jgi:hypothetical protein
MQCPHCFKDDLDDRATRCPHCTGRIRKTSLTSEALKLKDNASNLIQSSKPAMKRGIKDFGEFLRFIFLLIPTYFLIFGIIMMCPIMLVLELNNAGYHKTGLSLIGLLFTLCLCFQKRIGRLFDDVIEKLARFFNVTSHIRR